VFVSQKLFLKENDKMKVRKSLILKIMGALVGVAALGFVLIQFINFPPKKIKCIKSCKEKKEL